MQAACIRVHFIVPAEGTHFVPPVEVDGSAVVLIEVRDNQLRLGVELDLVPCESIAISLEIEHEAGVAPVVRRARARLAEGDGLDDVAGAAVLA